MTKVPTEITFRDIEPSPAIEDRVHREVSKLERVHQRITGCRVMIEAHHRHRHKGKIYHVRIDLTVPGSEIVVSRDPERDHSHEDVYVAIRDAFAAARRRLQDASRVMRGDVKTHEEPQQHGKVARLFEEAGHGFIETADGREVYFHRNSVLDAAFDRIQPGSAVWFVEEQGERGPQASTVRVAGKHGPAAA